MVDHPRRRQPGVLRVVIVLQPWDTLRLPFTGGGSLAIVGYRFAENLARREHRVVVYCGRRGARAESVDDGRITVRALPTPAQPFFKLCDRLTGMWNMSPPLMTQKAYYRGYFARIARDLAREGADVVHVLTLFQHVPALRQACPDAAIVLHMEGETVLLAPDEVVAPALREVDLVIGCSGFIVSRITERFPEMGARSAVVWNGIEPQQPVERSVNPPVNRQRRLLFIGRISPEKGVHVLVAAFNRIASAYPDVHLDLVGDAGLLPYSFHLGGSSDALDATLLRFYGSSWAEKLRRQVLGNRESYLADLRAAIGAEAAGRVHFVGPKPHAALAAYLDRASLFVFPSVWNEPFGMPVAEAMAAGLTVVSTESGGIPEIVQSGESGVLVPRGDPDALADAIAGLLDDPERSHRLGVAGRTRAETLFAWDVLTARLEGFYRTAVARRAERDGPSA